MNVVVGVLVFLFAAVYLSSFVYRGWLPHDEGLLAHSAERFLGGELPHRDFDDPYTGGLTFVHGLAFAVGGVDLTTIRTTLAIFVLAFVPALYWIASRHVPPYLAAAVTLTAVFWSVPNYFAALPSWHILFLSTFGTIALLKYIDTDQRRWLFAAGLCGGCAVLIKIVGLYFIAAALLFLAYHEQVSSRRRYKSQTRSIAFTSFIALIGATLTGLVVLLIRHDLGAMEFVNFVAPCAMLCMTLIWNDWHEGRGTFLERFKQLSNSVLWLTAGIVLPVVLFLIPFAIGGGLGDLFHGVFVLPTMRFQHAREPLQPLLTMLPIILPAILLTIGCLQTWKSYKWLTRMTYVMLAAVAVALLVFQGNWYFWNFYSLRGLLPVVVFLTCVILVRRGEKGLAARRRMELFLLSAIASLGILIQYPFASVLYFCYCAPLVLLAAHQLLAVEFVRGRVIHLGFLAFYLLFGLILNVSYGVSPDGELALYNHKLDLDRGQLFVHEVEKQQFEEMVALIQRYAPDGTAILATPDCPEVYFLSERRNPTRTMYDFFDDPKDREERLLRMIDEQDVQVVVINLEPAFSQRVSASFTAGLWERFEAWKKVGRFVVGVRRKSDRTGEAPNDGGMAEEAPRAATIERSKSFRAR